MDELVLQVDEVALKEYKYSSILSVEMQPPADPQITAGDIAIGEMHDECMTTRPIVRLSSLHGNN